MICDELLLIFLGHGFQRVECSFEVSFESIASRYDLLHDVNSLLLADTWTKWEVCKISSNSDSSRVDHVRLLLREISILKTVSCHVRNVNTIDSVTVIMLDHNVKELVELGVCVVRSGVDTDTGLLVGNTRENAHLE